MELAIGKFKEILTELKKVKEEEQLSKVDDNILFDGAIRIYNSILISEQRKGNSMQTKIEKIDSPMTDKQRDLLEDLDYEGDMNISKEEASEIIRKALDNQRIVR